MGKRDSRERPNIGTIGNGKSRSYFRISIAGYIYADRIQLARVEAVKGPWQQRQLSSGCSPVGLSEVVLQY